MWGRPHIMNAKVGDMVTIMGRSWGWEGIGPKKQSKVATINKTKLVLEDGTAWIKRNGHRWGSGSQGYYHDDWIVPAEPGEMKAHAKEIAERQRRTAVQGYNWRHAPDAIIEAVYKVINAKPKKAKTDQD